MADDRASRVTEIVASLSGSGSDPRRADELMPLVYDELRRLAERYLRGERRGHTLQATALVHEAYLKLVDQTRVDWQGRTHFFAVGARVMRHLLIDYARGRGRAKRGGDWHRVTLAEGIVPGSASGLEPEQLLALEECLERLTELDPRQARVVELRFFSGLTVEETAAALGVSPVTIKRDWSMARAWIERELEPEGES